MAKSTNLRAEGRAIAKELGIPWSIFNSMISHESGWDPNAVSPVGARGLGQLMPGTARGLGVDPNDPIQNLHGAARYLRSQFDRFKRWDLALAAYNAGPGAVEKYGGVPPFAETQRYVHNILSSAGGAKLKGTAPSGRGLMQPALPPGARTIQQSIGMPQGPSDMGGRLRQALDMSAPSQTTQSLLQRLGGTASRVSESAGQSIPLPPPPQTPGKLPPQVKAGAMAIEGAVDTEPQFPIKGAKPVRGMNAQFYQRLQQLFAAVRQAGGDISIYSGARDAAQQAILFKQALAKYGSVAEARKHVAPPGKSNHDTHAGLKHGWGDGALAGDLRGDLALAHRLAPQFGLVFPMSYEPWHIEPAGIRGGR